MLMGIQNSLLYNTHKSQARKFNLLLPGETLMTVKKNPTSFIKPDVLLSVQNLLFIWAGYFVT